MQIKLVFLCLVILNFAHAQEGTVAGKVIEKSTGQPVEYATIKLLKE